MDLSNYNATELKALRDRIGDELKTRHTEELESARALKAERAETYTGNVNTGDTVSFLYNREEREGVVERANPKSVTISWDGKKHYVSYENVVTILERAPEEVADEETEETEEVAQ